MGTLGAILASAGITIFENIIKDNGDALVKKGIEKVTGIQLDDKKELTKEEIQLIKDNDFKILSLDFEKLKLELLNDEKNREVAHQTYRTEHTMSDKIASQVISKNLFIIALLVFANIATLYYFKEDATLIAIVSNIIGIAIGNLFAERQAIINFFFGSSIGSKAKDKLISEGK